MALFVRWRLREIAQGRSAEDKSFAALVGISSAQWSRVKSGTPLGTKLARQFEVACGVEPGWMDVSHQNKPSEPTSAPLPPDMPGSLPATAETLASTLGLSAAELVKGVNLAESPTRAGFPSPAADSRVARLDLNAELVLHEEATMLVRVKGDSMRDAGILDGNMLVVDKALNASHGDIVVAVLDDEFTVKQLYRRGGIVKLLPAHPDFPAIVPTEGQELRIWGVVTSTIRRFR